MALKFDVVIMEDEEAGGYVAFVPALPGCHTQGETVDEVIKNIKEAIELYLETLSEEEKKELLSTRMEFTALHRVEVGVL
jgi:predicted RNase H-like HicB family nuclease